MRSETILAALEGESMQDPASELRRILIPRTWVNKDKKKGRGPDVGPRLSTSLSGFRLPTVAAPSTGPLW